MHPRLISHRQYSRWNHGPRNYDFRMHLALRAQITDTLDHDRIGELHDRNLDIHWNFLLYRLPLSLLYSITVSCDREEYLNEIQILYHSHYYLWAVLHLCDCTLYEDTSWFISICLIDCHCRSHELFTCSFTGLYVASVATFSICILTSLKI